MLFLIVICGLPGTGKTTLAGTLKQGLRKYVVIYQNDIRRSFGMQRMPKTQEKVLRTADRLIAKHLRAGRGVIFESGNRFSFRRQQLYGIASSSGCKVATVEVVCSEKTSKARMRVRRASKSRDALIGDPADPAVYDRIKKLWESVTVDYKYPGVDHVSYLVFNTDTNTVAQIFVSRGMGGFVKKLKTIMQGGAH